DIDARGLGVDPPRLQLLEAVLPEVRIVATRGVVVGGHQLCHSPVSSSLIPRHRRSRNSVCVVTPRRCRAFPIVATGSETIPNSIDPAPHPTTGHPDCDLLHFPFPPDSEAESSRPPDRMIDRHAAPGFT